MMSLRDMINAMARRRVGRTEDVEATTSRERETLRREVDSLIETLVDIESEHHNGGVVR